LPSTVDSKFFNVILIKKFILSNPLNFYCKIEWLILVQFDMRYELCVLSLRQNITKSKITYPYLSLFFRNLTLSE
jgi:hypothetical protein